MKRLFFDATYFGKLHWREPGSAEVLACAASADELVCSSHGRAEFYSIGFRKLREELTVSSTLRAVFAQFNADVAVGDIRLLPLTSCHLSPDHALELTRDIHETYSRIPRKVTTIIAAFSRIPPAGLHWRGFAARLAAHDPGRYHL